MDNICIDLDTMRPQALNVAWFFSTSHNMMSLLMCAICEMLEDPIGEHGTI